MPANGSFHVGQKAFIRRTGNVLVMLTNGTIDLPGGRIQEGEEDLVSSLRREVREETSLEIDVGRPFTVWLSPHGIYLVGFRCEYVAGEVVVSPEHDGFRWLSRSDLTQLDDGSAACMQLARYFDETKRRAD